MTRNSDQDKAWPPNTPGTQETEGDIQQLTPRPENNTQGLGEQMQDIKEVTLRCQNTNSLRDTGCKVFFSHLDIAKYLIISC